MYQCKSVLLGFYLNGSMPAYREHYPENCEAIRLSGGLIGGGVLAAVPVDQMQLKNV